MGQRDTKSLARSKMGQRDTDDTTFHYPLPWDLYEDNDLSVVTDVPSPGLGAVSSNAIETFVNKCRHRCVRLSYRYSYSFFVVSFQFLVPEVHHLSVVARIKARLSRRR